MRKALTVRSNISFSFEGRFALLSLLLLLLMVLHTLNGQWIGDFWEHSAVVRELATRPFSPGHPQLSTDSPHAFYSPYSLGIALVSRIGGLDPVTALSIAGIANLVLFLISLEMFVFLLLGRGGTAFYTLLFTLLLWGDSPWEYSGFFHLQSLGYVLPYPSTFAASLTFIALSMYITLVKSGNRLWLVPISATAVLVLLVHPLTFVVLCVGLVSVSLGPRAPAQKLGVSYPDPKGFGKPLGSEPGIIGKIRLRCPSLVDYGLLLCVFVLSFLVAATWPYYPFVELVTSESAVYHPDNDVLYAQVAKRIFPALVGLPLILLRFKSNGRDPVGTMAFGLTAVYAYGAFFGRWGYGRVISYIVLLLHMAIADGVSQIETKLGALLARSDPHRPEPNRERPIERFLHKRPFAASRLVCTCLIAIILGCLSFRRSIWPTWQRSVPGHQRAVDRYAFLAQIGQYDTVLSDLKTSWVVPTFGGKVVAVPHALAFVPDHDARRRDVGYFFGGMALHDARLEIVERYKVDYVLLNKDCVAAWQTIVQAFQPLGSITFSDDEFVLIDLRSSNVASTSQWLLRYPLPEGAQYPQVARFGDEAELLGYALDTSAIRPGGTLRVALYWHALRRMDTRYTVFVHLLNTENQIHGQWDGQPLHGSYPTDVWSLSRVVRDEYVVPVASDAPAGEYRLAVGLYELATMRRLPALDGRGVALADERVILDSTLVLE